jgi:6-phosphogluconolactonase
MTTLTTRRFASRSAFDAALAERVSTALAASEPAAIMLSGGTTPLPAYRTVGQQPPAHAPGLRLLFSDDRYVPADSPASNYHQSRPLIDALQLAPGALLRVRSELPLEEAAADYERQLRGLIESGTPITLALLGLGPDGHTASLFSAADIERSQGHLAIAVHRPDGMSAVSVTPALLAHVVEPLFAVAGSGKEDALRALMQRDPKLTAWRAVQGCPHAKLWVCEEA